MKSFHPRVLIVDDEEAICLGISEILKDEGFRAKYVTDGFAAIEEVLMHEYKLVFMDMIMPGMDGLETYRKISDICPDTKVILFTGYFKEASHAIAAGVEEGMIDDFIRKPYFADELVRVAKKYAYNLS